MFKIEEQIEKNKLLIPARMILDGKLGGTFSTAIVVILPFNEIVRGRGLNFSFITFMVPGRPFFFTTEGRGKKIRLFRRDKFYF